VIDCLHHLTLSSGSNTPSITASSALSARDSTTPNDHDHARAAEGKEGVQKAESSGPSAGDERRQRADSYLALEKESLSQISFSLLLQIICLQHSRIAKYFKIDLPRIYLSKTNGKQPLANNLKSSKNHEKSLSERFLIEAQRYHDNPADTDNPPNSEAPWCYEHWYGQPS